MKNQGMILFLLGVVILLFSTVLFPYVSNFVGWCGYKVWENRGGTDNIKESKQRKVFVRELNYEITGHISDLVMNVI